MLRNVLRATLVMALTLGVCNLVAAQYGGGGMGGGGMPGSPMHRSYGTSKGVVIGAIAGGAAAGAGFLLWKRHNRAKLQGCLSGPDKLVNEKDKQTYSLTNPENESLKPGERVQLVGKKAKDDSGEPTFEVQKMSKDLGTCTATSG